MLDFDEVVAMSDKVRRASIRVSATCIDIVAGEKAQGSKSGRVVGTFISHISPWFNLSR